MSREDWKRGARDLLPILAAVALGFIIGNATAHKTVTHEWVVKSCERIK